MTDRKQIEAILEEGEICHVACLSEGRPYSVPMCYGFDEHHLYLHSAPEGKKSGCFLSDGRVSISVVAASELKRGNTPCSFTFCYKSVIIDGMIERCDDQQLKAHGLGRIVNHYTADSRQYQDQAFEHSLLWRVSIDEMTAKSSD